MQRLRVKFHRGEDVKYISHLDIMRLWQRALNRAGIPLAYSEGFNPHPRMSLAAPLALGVTSEAELMDIVISRQYSPHAFTTSVSRQLPPGIEIEHVLDTPMTVPSLQSQVRFAEYRVEIPTIKKKEEIEAAIDDLLTKKELPWQHRRDTGLRRYDLRALINETWLIDMDHECCTIGMRLRCDSNGAGRPEQVASALGFEEYPKSIHRTRLILMTG
jgi:radical SAM-linked protein